MVSHDMICYCRDWKISPEVRQDFIKLQNDKHVICNQFSVNAILVKKDLTLTRSQCEVMLMAIKDIF